jgi:Lon protease-like protein
MTPLPIFPLGSALMPGMPLALRVFEERYLAMMTDLLATPDREFGVVLIERGHEVGGGDARFRLGTIARVAGMQRSGSSLEVVGRGFERFEVIDWLPDDPYPRAEVRRLPELPWSDADAAVLGQSETIVRRALARASEFEDQAWPATVKLPGEGAERAWRLAGIAPIGALDRYRLLGCTSTVELLDRLVACVQSAEEAWTFGVLPGPDADG